MWLLSLDSSLLGCYGDGIVGQQCLLKKYIYIVLACFAKYDFEANVTASIMFSSKTNSSG